MIDPGAFNLRLVLEEPIEIPDGAGGMTRGYADVATLWASVTSLSARGGVEADVVGGHVTHRIVIRAGPALTTRHRLRSGARIFRIAAYRDPDERGRFIEISAEERRE